MLNMQPTVAGLSVMDFNLCVYMCVCVLFVLPLCVSNIVCVFSFFILSEVLMNKDVYCLDCVA